MRSLAVPATEYKQQWVSRGDAPVDSHVTIRYIRQPYRDVRDDSTHSQHVDRKIGDRFAQLHELHLSGAVAGTASAHAVDTRSATLGLKLLCMLSSSRPGRDPGEDGVEQTDDSDDNLARNEEDTRGLSPRFAGGVCCDAGYPRDDKDR